MGWGKEPIAEHGKTRYPLFLARHIAPLHEWTECGVIVMFVLCGDLVFFLAWRDVIILQLYPSLLSARARLYIYIVIVVIVKKHIYILSRRVDGLELQAGFLKAEAN